jgi:hypothetical protein
MSGLVENRCERYYAISSSEMGAVAFSGTTAALCGFLFGTSLATPVISRVFVWGCFVAAYMMALAPWLLMRTIRRNSK